MLSMKRDNALDTLTAPQLSPSVRTALIERVEDTVRAVDTCLAQQRILQAGIDALNDQARILRRALDHPLLDATRWQEPEAFQALKQALTLLVHRMELTEIEPHTYVVDLWLYDLTTLVGGRENLSSESTQFIWSTNTLRAMRVVA